MNIWDILILLAIACAVVLGIRRNRKRNASGRSCCSAGCGTCTLCSSQGCPNRKPADTKTPCP